MKRSFKIHVDEVRSAAQKNGKTITNRRFEGFNCACPIGQLYLACEDVDKPEYYGAVEILQWAAGVYGKGYVDGFIAGFDYGVDVSPFREAVLKKLSKYEQNQFKLGHENGRRLRKFLLVS